WDRDPRLPPGRPRAAARGRVPMFQSFCSSTRLKLRVVSFHGHVVSTVQYAPSYSTSGYSPILASGRG
ncbi:MAG TPA: hypothetical protein PKV78_13305, partial [Methanoculleus thermophilus]|nr:hypothetical protein [Methanoculleus thermophilus]